MPDVTFQGPAGRLEGKFFSGILNHGGERDFHLVAGPKKLLGPEPRLILAFGCGLGAARG